MIGLEQRTVRLADPCPEWKALFETERALLCEALGPLALDIQHVGSTAVPGLPAKPIVDIALAVGARDDIAKAVTRLCAHGYIDRGDAGRDGGYLLVKDSAPRVRIVHLHLVETSDSQWREYLAFRDALRASAGLRERYAALKADLAARFPADRESYTRGKASFIRRTLDDCHRPCMGAQGPDAS